MIERPYSAVCQYNGKERFYLGTVVADANAALHEIEPLIYDLMDELFPTRPALLNIIPGSVVFVPEGGEEG
ncbi:hypothetical protein ABWH97_00095 [Nitratireductor sp. ac15]